LPISLLDQGLWLPDPSCADENGIVALGGDLRFERLLLAYHNGIFPWYSKGEPIIWWSPDPRFVLFPGELKVRKSLRQSLRRTGFEMRYDTAFAKVIDHCAKSPRAGQRGTWITTDMKHAYIDLHRRGFAHSVETWLDGALVGGLYGVAIGPFFFGESMFHLVSDASKAALVALVERYRTAPFIDCQVHNEFFESMGARHIPRQMFLEVLTAHIERPNLWLEAQAQLAYLDKSPD
jgi:leucyl/phenylalanyl-tRNA---protein transferase